MPSDSQVVTGPRRHPAIALADHAKALQFKSDPCRAGPATRCGGVGKRCVRMRGRDAAELGAAEIAPLPSRPRVAGGRPSRRDLRAHALGGFLAASATRYPSGVCAVVGTAEIGPPDLGRRDKTEDFALSARGG